MVRVITGHLACGRWNLKHVDGIPLLSHPQMFSRRNEFRIGPDQVAAVEVEKELKKQLQVRIQFTHDRYCQALINPSDLTVLKSMADRDETPPLAPNQTHLWIKGLAIFFVICIIFELVK